MTRHDELRRPESRSNIVLWVAVAVLGVGLFMLLQSDEDAGPHSLSGNSALMAQAPANVPRSSTADSSRPQPAAPAPRDRVAWLKSEVYLREEQLNRITAEKDFLSSIQSDLGRLEELEGAHDRLTQQFQEMRGHYELHQRLVQGILEGRWSIPLGNTGESALEFVYVPAGTYRLGRTVEEAESARAEVIRNGMGLKVIDSSVPAQSVTIVSGFFISRDEVTQLQFRAVLNSSLVIAAPAPGTENWPQTDVTWEHARQFCAALKPPIWLTIRLPTEVEWEYAARGPNSFLYATRTGSSPSPTPALVGSVEECVDVSWCGVRGLSTNAQEWCLDYWTEQVPPSTAENPNLFDPRTIDWRSAMGGRTNFPERVIRGGASGEPDVLFQAPNRRPFLQGNSNDRLGFRVVLVPNAVPASATTPTNNAGP